MKKSTQKTEFRFRLQTSDGTLVMNRLVEDPTYYIRYGRPQTDFIEYCLKKDACEKGVKVISYTIDNTGLVAIVEWLGKRR